MSKVEMHRQSTGLTIGRSPINTKNLFCYIISVIYLGSGYYPRTLTSSKNCRVQTKQKHAQKQSYKTHQLLLETEAILMFQQMTYIDAYMNFISVTCNPHNAKTTIGRYQRTNQPILITGRLSAHLWSKEISKCWNTNDITWFANEGLLRTKIERFRVARLRL